MGKAQHVFIDEPAAESDMQVDADVETTAARLDPLAFRAERLSLRLEKSRHAREAGAVPLFREEARRFMSLVAASSGNQVLALLVDALHRMS